MEQNVVQGAAGGDEIEVLDIAVGEPTFLSPERNQNCASLAVSRTGIVAAFYPKPGTGPMFCRTSADGGKTWGPEMASPALLSGGAESVALREGGVLKFLTTGATPKGEAEFGICPMDGGFEDGWFTLHSTFAWFNDDFTRYDVAPVRVYMPDAVTTKQTHMGVSFWPVFDKGKILQLANGDLLAPMYGVFNGDVKSRVVLSLSSDRGHTWRYYATVAYEPADPNPELPGQYNGYCEPTIERLPHGRMICVMRTQYSHLSAEYRPLYVSWSDDLGKTWTKPEPTNPHLMNIWPTLAALDNGVVVCQFGRPGFHVAFSVDGGHTWRDRVSFSDLPVEIITGQFDMIKVGPNRVAAIGSDAEGTKVWPIAVERVRVKPARTNVTGLVLDPDGLPVAGARVELGPNRYAADSWVEGDERDLYESERIPAGPPVLGYRGISKAGGYPVAETDARGRFEFKSVGLAEYVLTVEAEGFAPQWRHVNLSADPNARRPEFRLKAGRSVRGQVVDQTREPVGGACVVFDRQHIHADSRGFFHWAVESPVPEDVTVRVYKRYCRQTVQNPVNDTGHIPHWRRYCSAVYETIESKMPIDRMGEAPIVLKRLEPAASPHR